MKLLASKDGKQIWLQEVSRPFQLESPFSGNNYVCILFANDETITNDERNFLSEELVVTGCRFAVCAGYECSIWDDAIEWAFIGGYEDFSPPDEAFVMTTWLEDQSPEEVIFAGLCCTNFDDHDFTKYLVLFIGAKPGLREKVNKGIEAVWGELELPEV